MENVESVLVPAIAILVMLMTCGLILARMYRRASKETSFVRTGFGGQKVILNGGALVFPVLHETIPVNMNTLRLEVRRANQAALITRDRMRVDVTAEFYVRVQPTSEAIANAAQTLGQRTIHPESLKDLVEGKFVDALRSVAAEMPMEDLHEKRSDFVQKVQLVVSEDLLKNGLELETVSLTGLDQTGREFFNPDNAFDAQGLTRLTEEIEARRKQRNEIEQDTTVAVEEKNLEAEQKRLEISRDGEYARLEQQREVEIRRAEQSMEIARERANKEQQSRQAQIVAKQEVDRSEIDAQRQVEEQRILMEQQLKEKDISRERAVETATIDRQKSVELAEQDRAIAIAEKSRAQSEAQAAADRAKAEAVQAEEAVVTVREKERAERSKTIELVKAAEEAERKAIGITVAASAEKKAADDQTDAVKTLAEGEAEKERIRAQGEADAEKLRADAAERRYAVEAAGKEAINAASNVLSVDQVGMQVRLALIQALPDIIRESVKPMQEIDSIKILQVDGLLHGGGSAGVGAGGNGNGHGASPHGSGSGGNGDTAGGRGNLADQVVQSALRYRAQAPVVDALLRELGFEQGASLGDLPGAMLRSEDGRAVPSASLTASPPATSAEGASKTEPTVGPPPPRAS